MANGVRLKLLFKGLRCHIEDLILAKAVTQEVVQEEVMQFVGPDLVFGLLGYITLCIGGQQFGRDGCVNDIQQQVTHPAIEDIFRRIAHNITHQRLRHAGIDAVH